MTRTRAWSGTAPSSRTRTGACLPNGGVHRGNQRQVEESATPLLDGVEVENVEIAAYSGTVSAGIDWLGGVAKAGATGAAAYAGIPSAVGALGTASTGTAIGALSGAAWASATRYVVAVCDLVRTPVMTR